MRRVKLGSSGPLVSALGLGFWQAGSRLWGGRGVTVERVRLILEAAHTHEIEFIDTAEVYGWGASERLLGEALRFFAPSDFVVASKVGGFRSTREDVYSGVVMVWRRLGGRLDLIQHHWPPPFWGDVCGVIRGLEDAVREGLASYYGLSNYGERELEEAFYCSKRLEPVSNQVQYNIAYRVVEWGLIGLLESRGMGLIAWSPLAKGALAGLRTPKTAAQKGDPVFRAAASDEGLQRVLERVATALKATKSQVALAWLISKGALPIPGTLNPERVEEYARAGDILLSDELVAAIDRASERYLHLWGRRYSMFSGAMRLAPGTIQRIIIRGMGGI